jgi:Protein of unknown function (DUF3703)
MAFRERIRPAIEHELERAQQLESMGELGMAFAHLERAHVLGQQDRYWHVRVHTQMLRLGAKLGNAREVAGQVLRIVGAASKTPFGIYPTGNTGGANISPVKPVPIPTDLQAIIDAAKTAIVCLNTASRSELQVS